MCIESSEVVHSNRLHSICQELCPDPHTRSVQHVATWAHALSHYPTDQSGPSLYCATITQLTTDKTELDRADS